MGILLDLLNVSGGIIAVFIFYLSIILFGSAGLNLYLLKK